MSLSDPILGLRLLTLELDAAVARDDMGAVAELLLVRAKLLRELPSHIASQAEWLELQNLEKKVLRNMVRRREELAASITDLSAGRRNLSRYGSYRTKLGSGNLV